MTPTLLTVLVLVLFFGCVLVYISNKKIAANLYERTYRAAHNLENKSPYSIYRCINTQDNWGYGINRNGKQYNIEWFRTESEAMQVINVLEKSEGYVQSNL